MVSPWLEWIDWMRNTYQRQRWWWDQWKEIWQHRWKQ
jgi:hypothetical protein